MLWSLIGNWSLLMSFPRHLIMNDGCRITFLENSLTTEDFSLRCWEDGQQLGVRMVLGENSLAMKDSRWGSGMKVARSANAIARKWKSMQILCGSGIFPSLHHRKERWLRH